MKVSELHPEMHTLSYRLMRSLPVHRPWFLRLLNRLQRLAPSKPPKVEGLQIEDLPLKAAGLRLYRPLSGGSGAGLLYIHGGGYIMGNAGINDKECIHLARELGLTVASVDYRLAPGHPFPDPIDDCFQAWHVMQGAADAWGIDPARIAVAGQSAGGGLAAAVVQRIVDSGDTPPAAQVLMYPMLDDRTAADRSLDAVGHVLWNNRNNRAGWGHYLGREPGGDSAPNYAVPARRQHLAGLPPTWIGVGEVDLFYAEDCDYARRLREAGVACELHTAPGAPHAYDLMAPKSSAARAFVADYEQFLRRHLAL